MFDPTSLLILKGHHSCSEATKNHPVIFLVLGCRLHENLHLKSYFGDCQSSFLRIEPPIYIQEQSQCITHRVLYLQVVCSVWNEQTQFVEADNLTRVSFSLSLI